MAAPDIMPKSMIEEFGTLMSQTKTYKIGPVIRSSKLIGPNVILIGDAIHAVTPTLGILLNLLNYFKV